MDLQNLANNIFTSFKSVVQPALANLTNSYNQELKQKNQMEQSAVKAVGSMTNYLNTQYQNAVAKPINPFAGFHPNDIIDQISKTPLIDLTASKNIYHQLEKNNQLPFKSPTIGDLPGLIADNTYRPITRTMGHAVLQSAGLKAFKPEDNFQKLLFGNESFKDFSGTTSDTTNALTKMGVDKNVANPLSAGLVGLDTFINLLPLEAIGKSIGKNLLVQGTKDITKNAAEQGVKNLSTEEAAQTLKGLISYEDKMAKMGIPEPERAKISYNKAKELFQWDQATAEKVLGEAKFYATEKKKTFDTLFAKWIGERDAAQVTSLKVGQKFTNIPSKVAEDVIKLIETPTAKVNPEAKQYIAGIRTEYDQLFNSAKKAGLDVNYLQNYITHVWDKAPEEVEQLYRSAKQTFGFAKERKFPTYEEGKKMDLVPLYSHPSQIIAHYTKNLEQVKANINFFEALKKEGLIVDSAVGHGRAGFSPIVGNGFPTSISKDYAGDVVKGNYFAPTEIANVVNKLFSPEDESMLARSLDFTAKASTKLQDIHLAGGVPFTAFNAFSTTAGLGKEYLAGRLASPTINFLRSFSDSASRNFAAEHAETITKLAKNNIPVHMMNIEDLVPKSLIKSIFSGDIGHIWATAFNDKTFKNFMPSLQVTFFEDIEKKALSSGKSAEEAQQIAAQATKKFYGVVTTDIQAKRSKLAQDMLTTVTFAPKFRESMINVWKEALLGVAPIKRVDGAIKFNNPLSLENQTTTRFLIGSVLTYVAYSKLNEAMTGKPMAENPRGSEYELLVPEDKLLHNGSTTVYRIPFLPSLLTVPRAAAGMAQHTLQGDGQQVIKDARGLTSTLMQGPIGLLTNEDYFGNPIYGDGGQGAGQYLFQQYNHPFMGAVAEQVFPAKQAPPMEQTILKALEVPIRFTTTDKIEASNYYSVRDDVIKTLSPEEKSVFDTLSKKNTGDVQQTMSEAQLRLGNPTVLQAETKIAQEVGARSGKMIDPFYQLPEQYQKQILLIQSLPPGDATKSELTQQNQGWLSEYYKARTAYFDQLGLKPLDNGAPKLTSDLQKKMDFYYLLQKGTGERTAFINQNPDLSDYWKQKADYTNQQRAELGLPPIVSPYNSSSFIKKPFNRYASLKTKKVTTKAPTVKMTTIKVPKVKLKKPKQAHIKQLVLKLTGLGGKRA